MFSRLFKNLDSRRRAEIKNIFNTTQQRMKILNKLPQHAVNYIAISSSVYYKNQNYFLYHHISITELKF